MKILVIRFSSIGDIVLTSPVIRCLKRQLADVEIHFLTRISYREIVDYNTYIDVRHYLEDDLSKVISALKKEKFDLIVDLHNNLRTWKIKAALRRKTASVNKINFEKWVYVTLKWNIMPVAHVVDRYMDTVRDLGVLNDEQGLDFFISDGDEITPHDLPLTHLHGYIAIAIGAQHATKKLPVEKLSELVQQLHFPIILLGGPEDFSIGESIRNTEPLKIFNGCGKFSINQSASLVKRAQLVISHDTGMMHIAAAYQKKIISVWGNTVPAFGMSPYYGDQSIAKERSKFFEVEHLYCRPCSKIGYDKCPKKHFRCMKEIDVNEIATLVGKF